MKKLTKIFAALLISFVSFVPSFASAKVEMDNFKETVDFEISIYGENESYAEQVNALKSVDFSNYKESNDKVNVYIFRGSTCGYCFKAIAYFASLYEEYGQYFDLKTYEVWENSDNSALLTKAAKKVGVSSVGGVPFIIIGDKYWEGFAESYSDDIVSTIMDQYESENRYDVMDKLNDKRSDAVVIIWVVVLAGIVIGSLFLAKEKTK